MEYTKRLRFFFGWQVLLLAWTLLTAAIMTAIGDNKPVSNNAALGFGVGGILILIVGIASTAWVFRTVPQLNGAISSSKIFDKISSAFNDDDHVPNVSLTSSSVIGSNTAYDFSV